MTHDSTTKTQPTLRVVLMGAGIFAAQAHAPVIKSHPELFACVAVWSRRAESAQKLAADVDAAAFAGQNGLDKLLARPDVDAVVMALPIHVQPQYVIKVLDAKKHVLSEKPIAPNIEEAHRLVELYETKYQPQGLVWCVAENYCYESAWQQAAKAVHDENKIGSPLLVTLAMHLPVDPSNKYLKTPWRANPSSWVEKSNINTMASCRADHITGYDTMAAQLQFENGLVGVISVTFASQDGFLELCVTGTRGKVELKRIFGQKAGYSLLVNGKASKYEFGGIEAEFLAFQKLCKATTLEGKSYNKASTTDTPPNFNSPDDALAELALVEALIASGLAGGAVQKVPYQ